MDETMDCATDLLSKIRSFIDVTIPLFLQLIDNLPLFLRFLFVVLDFLLEVLLGLFVQLDQVELLLCVARRLQHVLVQDVSLTNKFIYSFLVLL